MSKTTRIYIDAVLGIVVEIFYAAAIMLAALFISWAVMLLRL